MDGPLPRQMAWNLYYKQNHEFETLPCFVRIMKSCENYSKRKYDKINHLLLFSRWRINIMNTSKMAVEFLNNSDQKKRDEIAQKNL